MWFDRASTVSSAEPLTTPRKIEGRANVPLLNCHKMKWVCISAVPTKERAKEASTPGTVPTIFVKARQSPMHYTSVRRSKRDTR